MQDLLVLLALSVLLVLLVLLAQCKLTTLSHLF
jgi:hypothetical protein